MKKTKYVYLPQYLSQEILTYAPVSTRDYLHKYYCGESVFLRVDQTALRIDVCTSAIPFPLIVLSQANFPNYILRIIRYLTNN